MNNLIPDTGDKLKKAYEQFSQDRLQRFIVSLRRIRAAQNSGFTFSFRDYWPGNF